jgi:hypothetical protein
VITKNPIALTIPNGDQIESTHEAHLDIPGLPKAATLTHIVPELAEYSLVSLSQICDHGGTATVTADNINIEFEGKTVMTASRSNETSLWHLDNYPISDNTQPFPYYANASVGTSHTRDIVAFFHAAMFSPVIDTLYKALNKGYITNVPGVTTKTLKKYPPFSVASIKGHLDQIRQHVRSTKQSIDRDEDNDDLFPIQLTANEATTSHYCYATIFEPTGKIYTDQTGNFKHTSNKGNNLLVIAYDYDSNAIFAEPVHNRSAKTLLEAMKKIHTTLRNTGFAPRIQIMDNECSDLMKQYLKDSNIKYQLAAPGQHRINAAERAIRTFKNHFIAGLCSVDDDFPINLWDRLLPQALVTINLLRGSRRNVKHSAWSQIYGPYDFNSYPIAPPGIRVLVHLKPNKRETWAPHASEGWYIGPAFEQYRCYKVYMVETKSERITDTLAWYPTKTKLPTATSLEIIIASLQDVRNELMNPKPDNSLVTVTPENRKILDDITKTFQQICEPNNRYDILSDDDEDDTFDEPIESSTDSRTDLIAAQPTTPLVQRVEDNFDIVETNHDHDIVEDNNATIPSPVKMERVASQRVAPSKTNNRTVQPVQHQHFTRASVRRAAAIAPRTNSVVDVIAAQSDHWPIPLKLAHTRSTYRENYVIEQSPAFAYFGHAINRDTGRAADYKELSQSNNGAEWKEAMSLEIGKLAKGNGTTVLQGTETIRFLNIKDIPNDAKITYAKIVCADRPEKTPKIRVRMTIGGNLITYDGTTSTKAAELPTLKLFINSVLSTPYAKFLTGDLKDFYLNTARMPEKDFAYMKLPINIIPDDIIAHYALQDLIYKDHVYVEVSKGIYGLPQAGKLANEQLIRHLEPYGYRPCSITPGLWRHDTRDIIFLLVVDDFGIKYTNLQDAEHLLDALGSAYKLTTDWTGERYCGVVLKWDYDKRICDISMPGYIERALSRFQHSKPGKPQDNPYKYLQPEYGARVQYAPDADVSPLLDAAGKKRVQEILGTLLYYARAVDPTMLVTISSLSTQQANPTQNTMKAVLHLLDYCATHPNATIRFHASDMTLHVESDASYLSESDAKSRYAGFFYLSDDPNGADLMYPTFNGPVLVTANIIKETVASAAEAELAGLFHNAQEALPLRHALEEMRHPQPPTPIQTDNSTASGLANDTVKQRRSKSMDMRFFWVRDKVPTIFNVFWNKGKTNRADYFSKQHPTSYHRDMRSTYLVAEDGTTNNYFAQLQQNEAPTERVSTNSEKIGKGVLIPESGLHPITAPISQTEAHSEVADHSDPGAPTTESTETIDSLINYVVHP